MSIQTHPPPPGTSRLGILRVLGLTEGSSRLVNTILVTRFRTQTKVMTLLSTVPTSDISKNSMHTLDLPSVIHNMNHVGIKSLGKVGLDTLQSSLGLEFAKVDDGLIAQVL